MSNLSSNPIVFNTRYFVTYINNFSRKVWVYLLKSKGKCLEKFRV